MDPQHRTDLSELDRAAVLAYEDGMRRTIDDPGRLKAVYSARFAAEPVRERLQTIADTCRIALDVDGCEANLVTDTDQVDIASGRKKKLERTLCKYVVSEGALGFKVESATTHRLVCESTAVTEDGVRAYLGLPLLWDEYAVGAFCVFSYTPRVWKPYEVQVLAGFAVAVVDTLSWDKST